MGVDRPFSLRLPLLQLSVVEISCFHIFKTEEMEISTFFAQGIKRLVDHGIIKLPFLGAESRTLAKITAPSNKKPEVPCENGLTKTQVVCNNWVDYDVYTLIGDKTRSLSINSIWIIYFAEIYKNIHAIHSAFERNSIKTHFKPT